MVLIDLRHNRLTFRFSFSLKRALGIYGLLSPRPAHNKWEGSGREGPCWAQTGFGQVVGPQTEFTLLHKSFIQTEPISFP